MSHASAAASAEPALVITDRYRVESLLGRGGMGAVYAVVDTTADRRLALKRLSSSASPSTAALFEREYHALAGLKHPCIVEVYDYGSDAEGAFYTMELIEGRDLSRDAPMTWRSACRDLRDAASILGLLHARCLIHRDLSPRNLLRSQSGRLKLIDFGALAPFGPGKELVGTPPFIAPETLQGTSLDQRVDMFALGALAYWLLTGVHAYPARTLPELPALWKHELTPPSELLAMIASDRLEPIPAELDQLVASLLRLPAKERLDNTAELIDRLNAIAELAPESHDVAAKGYLDSKSFVGRLRERERALELLGEAEQGAVRTLVVEGDAGVGRTRFLQELAVVSRLCGALPIEADSQLGARPYGVAEMLLMGLLRALPSQTRAVAAEHASILGHISKEARTQLGLSERPSMAHPRAEHRVRLLAALREMILTLSRDRLLMLIVDDAQAIDEESLALLSALASDEGPHRLFIVTALGRDVSRERSAALAHLRSHATRVRLLPLNVSETLELLRSMFGPVVYLERLAERLHSACDGNPAHCLELSEHLVETGLARYQDGMWSLPAELTPDSLPQSRQAAHVTRLERLTPDARDLARRLSVSHGSILALDHCFAVSDLPPAQVHELLAELTREGVLRPTSEGHRFVRAEVQASLLAELDDATRKLSHLRLGEEIALDEGHDALEQLRACLHFLRGGDLPRGYVQLRKVYAHYVASDLSTLRIGAPLLEQILVELRAREQDDYATVGVLALLSISGYFANRRYAGVYGDEAVVVVSRVLRLALAVRLRRWLGSRFSLIVALVVAGCALGLRRRRAPALQELIVLLMGVSSALAGTAATAFDREQAHRYARILRPFTALGRSHAANVTYQFTSNLELVLNDHPADAHERLSAFAARLQGDEVMPRMSTQVRRNFTAATISVMGILEVALDGPECLKTADQVEQFGPLYAMNADHLRACWYACQGRMQQAAMFTKRMEIHAVTLGSNWQVEARAPVDAFRVAMRLNDPSIMKRAVQELGRLSSEIPSLRSLERQARGGYLVLRQRYAQALPLLDTDEGAQTANWTRARGLLARALNGLGQHERARDVCLEALGRLEPADLRYVAITLSVQLELALAEAALGRIALAKVQLDKLLAQFEPDRSPITLGTLHEARARVSLRERDLPAAREQLAKMEAHYRKTEVPTLIEQIALLRREIDRAENPRSTGGDEEYGPTRPEHVMTRVQLLLTHQSHPLITVRAQEGLQLALEMSTADEGFIVLADNVDEPVAHLGSAAPSADLVQWAQQNLLDASVDEQTVMTAEVDSEIDSNYKAVGSMRYCVVPLWAHHGDAGGRNDGDRRHERVIAALVLGFDGRVPQLPEPALMRAIAVHLSAGG